MLNKYSRLFEVIILILSIISFSTCTGASFSPNFHTLNETRTGHLSIFPITGGLLYSSPIFSFQASFNTSIPTSFTTFSSTVGIVGYETPITNDFNTNFTVYSVNNTQMIINLQVYGDMRMVFFSINYLVMPQSIPYIQLKSQCFESSIINKGFGVRYEKRNLVTSFIKGKLLINSFFNGFKVSNSIGMTHILTLTSFQTPFSRNISSVFHTNQNNSVSSICYTVFVHNSSYAFNGNSIILIKAGYQQLSNTTKPDSMTDGTTIYQQSDRMFFGTSGFSIKKKTTREFFMNTTSYSDLSLGYRTNLGINYITMSFLMLVERQQCIYSGTHQDPSNYFNNSYYRGVESPTINFTLTMASINCFAYDYYVNSTFPSTNASMVNATTQSTCFHQINSTNSSSPETIQCTQLTHSSINQTCYKLFEYKSDNPSLVTGITNQCFSYQTRPPPRPELPNMTNCYHKDSPTSNQNFTYCVNIVLVDTSCNQLITVDAYFDSDSKKCIDPYSCHLLGKRWSGDDCAPCHYSCFTCIGLLNYQCLTCSSLAHRTLLIQVLPSNKTCICDNNYFDLMGQQLCIKCDSVIQFCNNCFITNYQLKCSDCGIFFFNNVTNKCQCGIGFVFMQYLGPPICINTYGCTNFIANIGYNTCISCNTTANFLVSVNMSNQCQCMIGYYPNQNICYGICGDGIVISGEGCDDNNTNDGDGCSKNCSIQSNWACDNLVKPSVCILINNTIIPSTVSLKIGYIRRNINQNTMKIQLMVQTNDQINTNNIKSMILHNVSVSDFDVAYSNTIITLYFHYNQTIEGKTFYIMFKNSTIQFQAIGMNAMLTYDSQYFHNKILQTLAIVIGVFALLVLFVSTFIEKMIGIQLIQTIQSIFFMLAFLESIPSSISCFEQLRYSNGYNLYTNNNYTRIYPLNKRITCLGIQKQFFISFNLMFGLLFLSLAATLLTKLCLNHYQKILKEVSKVNSKFRNFIKYTRVKNISQYVFQRLFFVLCFLSYFNFVFAINYQLTNQNILNNNTIFPFILNIIPAFITFSFISFLFLHIFINYYFNTNTNTSLNYLQLFYIPLYILYQSIFILCVSLGYTSSSTIYLIIILIVIKSILIVVFKPYKDKKQYLALIFNQIIILISAGVFFYIFSTQYDSQNEIILVSVSYLILLLLVVAIFWSIYRLYKIQSNYLSHLVKLKIQEQYDVFLTNQLFSLTKDKFQKLEVFKHQPQDIQIFTLNQRKYGHPQLQLIEKQQIIKQSQKDKEKRLQQVKRQIQNNIISQRKRRLIF